MTSVIGVNCANEFFFNLNTFVKYKQKNEIAPNMDESNKLVDGKNRKYKF